MDWVSMRCHWCGSGDHPLLENRPGRRMCRQCFELSPYEDFRERDSFEDPGTEGEDVDARSENENDDITPGEDPDEGTDRESEDSDHAERIDE